MDNYFNLVIIIFLLGYIIYNILLLLKEKFINTKECYSSVKYRFINESEILSNEKVEIFNKINCYVIHLERSTDRIKWIEQQQAKTNFKINYFNAIDGKNLDKDKLIEKGILDPHWGEMATNNHHACFLSHRKLIKTISNLSYNDDYSIIFEDDFNILSKNFDYDIINIISYFEKTNTDFDMIFLGNYNLDFIYYDNKIFDNIYTPSPTLNITLEGYIINNKSAKKIYSLLNYINLPVDIMFQQLRNDNKLIAYVINPALTKQNRDFESTIG